jgi:hypothetical protein
VNEREIEQAIRLAKEHRNVVRIMVGNEVLLRGDLSHADLIAHLEHVRAATRQPVSTAEPWHVWMLYPELAEHVDYIAVHMLPYWEGLEVEAAVEYVVDKMALLEQTFPGKEIVIGEVGWPSDGRTRESAVATTSNQALFLRRFLDRAKQEGYVYYVMEAFDQPWKERSEGKVGGLGRLRRGPRAEIRLHEADRPRPALARARGGVGDYGGGPALALLFTSRTLRNRGRSFLAMVVYATATLVVWILYDFSQQYMTITSVLVGALLLLGMAGVIAVLLAEAHEWAEAHWVTMHRRILHPRRVSDAEPPRVSIHVPACNEPPQLLVETRSMRSRGSTTPTTKFS